MDPILRVGGMLALLAMLAGLTGAALGIALALATGRRRLVVHLTRVTAVAALAYAGLLFAASATSRERVLGLHEEKPFCAADCDLFYSIDAVDTPRLIVASSHRPIAPAGRFLVVSVRVRSDAKRVTITPSDPAVVLLAPDGRRFERMRDERLLSAEFVGARLDRPLAPGESRVARFVFDVPEDLRHPRLLVTEGGWMTRLVIGDENSPLHRKTLFRLT